MMKGGRRVGVGASAVLVRRATAVVRGAGSNLQPVLMRRLEVRRPLRSVLVNKVVTTAAARGGVPVRVDVVLASPPEAEVHVHSGEAVAPPPHPWTPSQQDAMRAFFAVVIPLEGE